MSTTPAASRLSSEPSTTGDRSGPRLTSGHLVLLVVAAAAPLGSMIGNVPLGILLGNGAGLPSAFLAAGVIIACLACGYVALNTALGRAGGFAAFIEAGLGRSLGLGAAYATTLAYWAGSLSLAVSTGYFGSLILGSFGIDTSWWVLTLIAVGLTWLLGRRAADLSAKVLVGLMIAEFVILLILDVAILSQRGITTFSTTSFTPSTMLSGNIGPALLCGFTSFIGVESAILYTREARNPGRSVRRATFASVILITLFYVLTSWIIIGGVGADQLLAVAGEAQGDLVFVLGSQYGGTALLTVMQVFFVTSLLACLIALHNATARYVQKLAADGDLPRGLARLHPKHEAPTKASDLLALAAAIILSGLALTGADPYLGLGTSLTGLFTVGIFGVQVLVAVAVIVYFRRARDRRWWTTLTAPAVGGIGVLIAVGVIVANYSVLTGVESGIANWLPLLLLLAVLAGPIRSALRRSTSLIH